MDKAKRKSEKELSLDESLDQIIDLKKSENSALKKIFDSLQTSKENKKKSKH